jgi:hypothetical protein
MHYEWKLCDTHAMLWLGSLEEGLGADGRVLISWILKKCWGKSARCKQQDIKLSVLVPNISHRKPPRLTVNRMNATENNVI